jgi:hypothetical protein
MANAFDIKHDGSAGDLLTTVSNNFASPAGSVFRPRTLTDQLPAIAVALAAGLIGIAWIRRKG